MEVRPAMEKQGGREPRGRPAEIAEEEGGPLPPHSICQRHDDQERGLGEEEERAMQSNASLECFPWPASRRI